jgi:hypothetical protein
VRTRSIVVTGGMSAILLALAALVPSPSRSQTAELESFHGSFVFTQDQAELTSMNHAIDRVVDQLNLFIREIARSEIRRRITPEHRIRLAVQGDRVTVSFDQWGPVELAIGGPGRQVQGPAGDRIRASVSFRGGRLIERRIAARGSRTNVFRLSADAQRLHMEVRIASEQLPAHIRYRLSYRRAG